METIIQLINRDPHSAYYKLINTREKYDQFNDKFKNQKINHPSTTQEIENAVRETLLVMFAATK